MQASSTFSQQPPEDNPDSALARMLAQRNAELDQFAYVVSHDLRAPLRGIANLAKWIEEDLGDQIPEETAGQLALLRNRVHRMDAMIQGILQYSRVGRVDTQIEMVDIRALVTEAIDLLAPPPTVEVRMEGDFPALPANFIVLEQVFLNLIGNAIKHCGSAEAQVRVIGVDHEEFCEFHVVDNGPGIEPQFHERIFQIFQTLESRDKVEGIGMGLALVKKIVEHQGGVVSLKSDVGQGADFSFTWLKTPDDSATPGVRNGTSV
ncbi:MAG: domain S-box [Capsulimonas sp.]|jgi:light-regulated signal transduction histidine kinase (bacteriophytochrome)|nr:domain S-box [Capsulimonas sp.]